MLKKILFSLAALSIYANAINCLEAYFKTKPVDYYVPEDYVLHSLYRAPAEGADSKPWSKKYYYTPGNSLPDSLVLMDSKDTVKTVLLNLNDLELHEVDYEIKELIKDIDYELNTEEE